eukprot:COSAG01_NODE_2739_length_7159_cov_15.443343_3_plen_111_part_00
MMPRGVPIHQRQAYGPVQLVDTAPDFAGCVVKTNNTAEMTAVLHVMADVLIWRKRMERASKLRRTDRVTLIMVYDSWYAMTRSNAPVTRPTPATNQAITEVARRLRGFSR